MGRWQVPVTLAATVAALVACSTTGSGHVISESRPVAGFTKIDLSGRGEVTIDQNGTEALTVEAEDNLMPKVTSQVVDGTLRLGEKSNLTLRQNTPIKYRVSVKEIAGLIVSGSGTVTATKITTPHLSVDISGSGTVTLGGSVEAQELAISGSGDYQAKDLPSKTTTAEISGSGDAAVAVSDRLDVEISGSGGLTYYGNPPQVTQQVSGSGRVTKG
jgi:Putative auto-transporter adhesin, head GIN domain